MRIKSVAIEHARAWALPKPWGILDLRPWSNARHEGGAIGEIWYERSGRRAARSSLLLKILFTDQPLSIQVHPDDAFAHSIGLPHGKTEAWYVLRAAPEAKVALGLNQRLTSKQLRAAVDDGSISKLVVWQAVSCGDAIFVPAGTIHAIGPGLVVAEIQQRSDATFRLFDHGRQRELHVDNAVAAANAGPAECQPVPRRIADARTLLLASPHFVLERIELSPKSNWTLHAEHETWFLVVEGHARVGRMDAFVGEAIFLEADHTNIKVGSGVLKGLLAYLGTEPSPSLLHNLDVQNAGSPIRQFTRPPLHHRASADSLVRPTKARL